MFINRFKIKIKKNLCNPLDNILVWYAFARRRQRILVYVVCTAVSSF